MIEEPRILQSLQNRHRDSGVASFEGLSYAAYDFTTIRGEKWDDDPAEVCRRLPGTARYKGLRQVEARRMTRGYSTAYICKMYGKTLKYLIICCFGLMVATGCGSSWFPDVRQVDQAALDDVRSVGRVVAETMYESRESATYAEIINVLVLDVQSSDQQAAMKLVHDRFRARGWVDHGKPEAGSVRMRSTGREQTEIQLGSWRLLADYSVDEKPQFIEAYERPGNDSYVAVAVVPFY
jgi:hypothetical protein